MNPSWYVRAPVLSPTPGTLVPSGAYIKDSRLRGPLGESIAMNVTPRAFKYGCTGVSVPSSSTTVMLLVYQARTIVVLGTRMILLYQQHQTVTLFCSVFTAVLCDCCAPTERNAVVLQRRGQHTTAACTAVRTRYISATSRVYSSTAFHMDARMHAVSPNEVYRTR